MTTAAERARGIALWVAEGATQEEVIEALVKADQASMCWGTAKHLLPAVQIHAVELAQHRMLTEGAFDASVPHDGSVP